MDSDGDMQVWAAPQSYATNNLCPRFAGRLLSFGLYGICFNVCARYFLSQDFWKDSVASRCYIILVVALNTAATVMLAVDSVSLAMNQERTLAFFGTKLLSDTAFDYVYFFAIILPQLFLARRAFVLTVHARSSTAPCGAWRKPAPLIVLGVLVVSISASLVGYVADLSLDTKQYFDNDYNPKVIENYGFVIALFGSAVTDITISVILGWHWVRWLRANEGFNRRTDSVLRKLIAFTLATALFTTIPAGLAAIFMAAFAMSNDVYNASTDVYVAFSDLLPPLYSIALFTTLGIRRSLRERQPFQMTAPTPPTLRETKMQDAGFRPGATLQSTLNTESDREPGHLAVELESGGFGIPTVDYTSKQARTAHIISVSR